MAYPATLYVTLDNETYFPLEGVKYRKKVLVDEVYDGSTFNYKPQGLANFATEGAAGDALASFKESSDDVLITGSGAKEQVPPRPKQTKYDEFHYLDSPDIVFSCGTTNTSNTITVPSTTGLIVGMGVSGTGITAGSVILSLPTETTVLLSQPATATGTVNLTFTGNVLGRCRVSMHVSDSASPPVYLA